MTGTFGSLNIAKTGLQYQQLVLDTASNNISNVNTDGYVRRRVVGGELGTSATSALWSTSDGHGGGVQATDVQRLTDQLLDTRVRREHATLSSLLTSQASLTRVETAINEPSDTGVAAALDDFKAALQDLATNPDKSATRGTALTSAATLTQALRSQAQSITDEQDDLAQATTTDLAQVNDDAKQLAQLNHSIFVGQASGVDVGTLLDQRDQIALDLANRAGAVSTVGSDGRMTVAIGSNTLVDGDNAYSVSAASDGSSTYQITDPADGSVKASGMTFTSGELGGIAAASTALATYRSGLDQVAQQIAASVNAVQQSGYDLTGGQDYQKFFDSDPAGGTVTAANITVALSDGSQIAASTVASTDGNYDGQNADDMVTELKASGVDDAYQALVTNLGAQISGLNSSVTTQQALATQADDAREQQTGVSLDEETINMVAAQHAYEASSRVLTVMDSILNTLINNTGVG